MAFEEHFKGKKVLITGASRGIGKGIASKLHEYGAEVFALSKNQENLQLLECDLPGIKTICVDLEDWDATGEALDVEEFGPFDFLVNNAGINPEPKLFLDITPNAIDQILGVNFKGVINVSQIFAEKLIAADRTGSIVNISSISSQNVWPYNGLYAASKAALDSISKTMANEFGKHSIRVNSISLGVVLTDMFTERSNILSEAGIENADKPLQNRFPMGKSFVEVEQIVNAVLFLLSDTMSMATGSTLVIDGGFSVT